MLIVSTPSDELQGALVELGAVAHLRIPGWRPHTDSIAVVVGADPGNVHLALGLDCETTDIASLWSDRIRPFEANLRSSRRAPRRQQPVLAPPDPTWPEQAQRLIARLKTAMGSSVHRIDHIGSTSVPGLPAKDLIDVQVVVNDLAVALQPAGRALRAGFVHVAGDWYGEDRHGTKFREEVVVDADPGRPVNVNIRPVADPVWQDSLWFRDLLRTDTTERDAYAEMKRSLEAHDIDVDRYGELKMAYIREVLRRTGERYR
jgi:GrpB-like predicted nucleotidyltransferase (UPF0157 family)